MSFDPLGDKSLLEIYLKHTLDVNARLIHAERLSKSTREAPWRIDVEHAGGLQSFVLQAGARLGELEFAVLQALEAIALPTPRVYGWDGDGQFLGVPCFLSDYLEGDSLLKYVVAAEPWAEALYLDTVCALQEIERESFGRLAELFGAGENGADVLEAAYAYFQDKPSTLADRVYHLLRQKMPALPAPRFSNGDLWLDNFIVRDKKLVGVIDFEHAGFSDPVYEFLLPFFVEPELRERGLEERYCVRMGIDPGVLPWYRGLELFDTWRLLVKTGKPFVHYTPEILEQALNGWLVEVGGAN